MASNVAGDGLSNTVLAQAVFWVVVVAYLALAWTRIGPHDAIYRAIVLLLVAGVLYLSLKKPITDTVSVIERSSGYEEFEDVASNSAARRNLEALRDLETGVQSVHDQVSETVNAITDKIVALNAKVTDAVARLSTADQELTEAFAQFERRLTDTRTVRIELMPPRRGDPELMTKALPHVKALAASNAYRASVIQMATDAALTDEIEHHLNTLHRQSSLLYTRSVMNRGASSPRMKAWEKDNTDAADSIQKVQPLLRRLRSLNGFDGALESNDSFLAGLRSPELTAMGFFLARNPDEVETEQQVRTALEKIAKGLLRQWLAPSIRLYQLLYEALPIEDEANEWPAHIRDLSDPSFPGVLDSIRAAATTLQFEYVHHTLYTDSPFEIGAKVDQTTRRHSFADWIAGETGSERHQAIAIDMLGRITMPHFKRASSRPFETEIIIISGDL